MRLSSWLADGHLRIVSSQVEREEANSLVSLINLQSHHEGPTTVTSPKANNFKVPNSKYHHFWSKTSILNFLFLFLFHTTPVTYGNSPPRGWIWAVAEAYTTATATPNLVILDHSHICELSCILWQCRSLTHWAIERGQVLNLHSHGHYTKFLIRRATKETPLILVDTTQSTVERLSERWKKIKK